MSSNLELPEGIERREMTLAVIGTVNPNLLKSRLSEKEWIDWILKAHEIIFSGFVSGKHQEIQIVNDVVYAFYDGEDVTDALNEVIEIQESLKGFVDNICLHVFTGHKDIVTHLVWSEDESHAFSGGRDGLVYQWDLSE